MIYYLVTKRHAYTAKDWVEYYQEELAGRIRVLPYSKCHGTVEAGTFIFSDFERLSGRRMQKATKLLTKLRLAGCHTLNHPSDSLRRYDLQKALRNDFRVFRSHEVPDDLRYPVFLRMENDHRGSQTDSLPGPEQLIAARKKFPKSLVVEFLDTRDQDGYYRKYSSFRIGERVVPRHVLFSREWLVKKPDFVSDATVREELDYIERNPHEARIREIFDIAGVDYGRIDYSVYEGRIQTWEINSNPMLTVPNGRPSERYLRRLEIHERTAAAINEALLKLDVDQVSETVRLGMSRSWNPESRFAV